MKVSTSIKTLGRAKALLNDLGIGNIIDKPGQELKNVNVMGIIDKLIDHGKFVDFMQIITKDTEKDWSDVDMPELAGYIHSFFVDIMTLFPESLRNIAKINLEK